MKIIRLQTAATGVRAQAGFSIVELMVALAIGSAVVLAAISLLTTNQRTFQLQQGLTDVQQQGRFALDYLSADLRRSGYFEDASGLGPGDVGLRRTAITIGGVNYPPITEGGAAATADDRLTFSYWGDVDCEGDTLGTPAVVVNTYFVNNGDLVCQGSIDATTTGIALVVGVESFQVLYGVDDGPNGGMAIQRYKRADQVLATDVVGAVRLAVLIGTPPPAGGLNQTALNFAVLDKQLTAGTAPLDQPRIRRLFTTTVMVRNFDGSNI